MKIFFPLNDLKKYSKIYILLTVFLFAVGITVQIAAIKLAGGFCYYREAQSLQIKYVEAGLGSNSVKTLISAKGGNLLAESGSGCFFGIIISFLFIFYSRFFILPANIFLPLNDFFLCGYARIRPPTTA
ncbi:MAG: hypothetical protein WCX69_02270 [Candidatus Paceibacterota bacterium]